MADDGRAPAPGLALTPLQRLEWLEQTLDLLRDTEALAADRERRRLAAAAWWAAASADDR